MNENLETAVVVQHNARWLMEVKNETDYAFWQHLFKLATFALYCGTNILNTIKTATWHEKRNDRRKPAGGLGQHCPSGCHC